MMMRLSIVWIALAMAFATGTDSASAQGRDVVYLPCRDTGRTNDDFARCGERTINEEDRSLSIAWRRLFQDLGGTGTEAGRALLAEQRAWIVWREQACLSWWVHHGREGEVLHGPLCIASVINARTNELNIHYDTIFPR